MVMKVVRHLTVLYSPERVWLLLRLTNYASKRAVSSSCRALSNLFTVDLRTGLVSASSVAFEVDNIRLCIGFLLFLRINEFSTHIHDLEPKTEPIVELFLAIRKIQWVKEQF